MKYSLTALCLGVILLTACHKNELDIADLNTNPFDPDYVGELAIMSIGAIQTETYAQGLHKQTMEVRVHPDHFPAPRSYVLYFTKPSAPYNLYFYSSSTTDNIFQCSNYQITLGEEYCYQFKLVIGGETVKEEMVCAIAEL